jgi:hypothetical protein
MIRCGYEGYITPLENVAMSLGFDVVKIIGNCIVESDLQDAAVLVLFLAYTPYYTQTEIDLILDFIADGKGFYIVPGSSGGADTYYNLLWKDFGFEVTGERHDLTYPHIKNVTFTHPIMDGISEIEVGSDNWRTCDEVELEGATPLVIAEGYPLFLASSYGKGKIFVDLCVWGITRYAKYDNRKICRNALIWLKGYTKESFSVDVDGEQFETNILSTSVISSFQFEKESKSINFQVTGLLDTEGVCNVSVPNGLMWCDTLGQWEVTVDGDPPTLYSVSENGISTSLYFTYCHSTHEVKITSQYVIPEFPSFLILPLFMLATLLVAILYRRATM